jgi:phosphoglycolate phosphatase-like HAD superfamily hydrolase
MRLGFDLDEVVVELAKEFETYLAVNYGIEWPPDCFVQFSINECTFSEDDVLNAKIKEDLIKVANDAEFQFAAEPKEGAQKTLQKLKRVGHKLYFITSRPKQNQPLTFKWLRKYDIPFDKLELVGNENPKGPCAIKI